ncbi:MAG: 2,3-bisphosphoglycerate-independent phosphoglycerate mutase, partial [Rhodothermia bacterium]
KHILIILDGYGIAVDKSVSAIDAAEKPFLDSLFAKYPHARLEASGLAVGLPDGQMGNSEVGHMNLGAGRVVYQEITRIDRAIENGDFSSNRVFCEAAQKVRSTPNVLHCMGLFSDGGVHSSLNHLYALLELCAEQGLTQDQVQVHAFTDGRDTDPHGALKYAREFDERAKEIGVGRIASVVGRYFAMDRDNRWERIQLAYELLVDGVGRRFPTAEAGIESNYTAGVTDEFIKPFSVIAKDQNRDRNPGRIRDDDSVVFFNFRADRARQMTHVFIDQDFDKFERLVWPRVHYVTMTPYDARAFEVPVAFPKENLNDTIGSVIESHGLNQLRAAETEKYPHVTYFFSGGNEDPFRGEERILAPSPKVATYDLKPEMSARQLARKVAAALTEREYALVVLNFANPDMVGHTGVFEAAVAAVEAADEGARIVVQAALEHGYSVEIIADHGNADKMRNPDGSPNTAHTTALVPHLIIRNGFDGPIRDGKLGDVAPTMLRILGLPIPEAMTGDVLIDLSG